MVFCRSSKSFTLFCLILKDVKGTQIYTSSAPYLLATTAFSYDHPGATIVGLFIFYSLLIIKIFIPLC